MFTFWKQLDDALKNGEVLPYNVYQTCLRMDGQTLVNLEIFGNSFDGGSSGKSAPSAYVMLYLFVVACCDSYVIYPNIDIQINFVYLYFVLGTLYKHLNHCITASGKRLLRRWICHPLKDVDAINKRLDIVEGFIQHCGVGSITLEHLRKIPDLERLLGRVRSTVGLTSAVLLPFVGEKTLKRRVSGRSFLVLSQLPKLIAA